MNVYKKLTVHNGWVNGFTHHPGFRGGPLPTSAVMGLLSHTMVGNLPHTDAMFTPGPQGVGNSAHFGTAQDGTVIQWVPLGVVAFHALMRTFTGMRWRTPITRTPITHTPTCSSRASHRSSS